MGVLMSLFFWVFDSWVDSVFFEQTPFTENLLPDGMDMYMRVVVTLMMLLFSYVASKYLDASNRLNEYLIRDSEVVRNEFKLLYEHAPVAVIILNQDLYVMDWNVEAEKIFGWNLAEVHGLSMFDLIVPQNVGDKKTSLVEAFKQPGRLTGQNMTKDGRASHWNWRHAPVHNHFGELIQVVLMASVFEMASVSKESEAVVSKKPRARNKKQGRAELDMSARSITGAGDAA